MEALFQQLGDRERAVLCRRMADLTADTVLGQFDSAGRRFPAVFNSETRTTSFPPSNRWCIRG
jgi:hypothetical protein